MREEQKIEDQIIDRLGKQGRGQIFFAQEFYDLWPESSVRFALSNLNADGRIARLARGVFCFPELSEYGMKMILPDIDTIAHSIADKTKVRIVPYGDQAAYLVGLTSVQFSSSTYLTDGAPRKIHLANGRTIEFRHTSEMRIFAFTSRKMQLMSNAMRALGRANIRVEEKEALKWHLDSVPLKDFEVDINLCPEWVRDILLDLKVN